jgi:hypothetical protein
MKRHTVKRPEVLEVRGVRFMFVNPPPHWSENYHKELMCDKCGQHLLVLFAARNSSDVAKTDPRWWVPTAVTCTYQLPRPVALIELPKKTRKPKRDRRQLEMPAMKLEDLSHDNRATPQGGACPPPGDPSPLRFPGQANTNLGEN